ncbi:hypothetical protein AMATHDRAFT_134053 [Amanita thiersii Skay4041]|uniref:Uncharacterized protein n=1 Tax=Amanita thiersii Skay4041 TaxID=703135 RepID=A0A2A9P094_9AGAR|nr:hypothetical protein AMATHDRAFT_134053 [Amanita thiersii Skay4041]
MIISKQLEQHSVAGPSTLQAPPPSFTDLPDVPDNDETAHLLVFTPHSNDQLDPPPEFAPYEAEFFSVDQGNVISHDAHLNTDGEALYRFLLSQSLIPPVYQLHCRGTHTETRYRYVTSRNSDGRSESHRESYTDTITDFDFYIDIHPPTPPSQSEQSGNFCGPIHWSVADSEPAFRGRMVREIDLPNAAGKRKVGRQEQKQHDAWYTERASRGLPPWIGSAYRFRAQTNVVMQDLDDSFALQSSKTLREWADEYCASPKCLKEFVYKKVLYGWDFEQLERAIRTIISTTPYNGNLEVSFIPQGSKVTIRPDNRLSRMLSNKWLKFLSIILLIFPFIWLFKRFHSRGGGRWEVCGGAYALKRWVPEQELLPELTSDAPLNGKDVRGPTNGKKLIGTREGEWFRKWEGVIRRCVISRYQSTTPIINSDTEEDRRSLVGYLDGY